MEFLGKVVCGALTGMAYVAWAAVCLVVGALVGLCAAAVTLVVGEKIGFEREAGMLFGVAVGLVAMITCFVCMIQKVRKQESRGGGRICDPQHPNQNWE